MANLKAKTEPATANAKGFVADEVVTYTIAKEYKGNGCSFCLRLIELSKDESTLASTTDREIYSIMSNSSTNSSGLSFMPLIRAQSANAEDDLTLFPTRMNALGLPINMTVWLDEESVKKECHDDIARMKTYRKEWAQEVIKAGYSAGYYYGGVVDDGCSCDSSELSNSVLSMVECGTSSASHKFKIITIGDNKSDACQIRWAYLGASS